MKPDKKLHYFVTLGISLAFILLLYFFVTTSQIIFLYVMIGTLALIFGKEAYDTFKPLSTGFSVADIIYGVLGLTTGMIAGKAIISILQIFGK